MFTVLYFIIISKGHLVLYIFSSFISLCQFVVLNSFQTHEKHTFYSPFLLIYKFTFY